MRVGGLAEGAWAVHGASRAVWCAAMGCRRSCGQKSSRIDGSGAGVFLAVLRSCGQRKSANVVCGSPAATGSRIGPWGGAVVARSGRGPINPRWPSVAYQLAHPAPKKPSPLQRGGSSDPRQPVNPSPAMPTQDHPADDPRNPPTGSPADNPWRIPWRNPGGAAWPSGATCRCSPGRGRRALRRCVARWS